MLNFIAATLFIVGSNRRCGAFEVISARSTAVMMKAQLLLLEVVILNDCRFPVELICFGFESSDDEPLVDDEHCGPHRAQPVLVRISTYNPLGSLLLSCERSDDERSDDIEAWVSSVYTSL